MISDTNFPHYEKDVIIILFNQKDRKGSATVEALAIFPIILFFFMSITWLFNLFFIHSQIEAVVSRVGTRLVNISYPYNEITEGIFEDNTIIANLLGSVAFSELYLRNEIKSEEVYKEIENLICMVDMISGEDAVRITVYYRVRPKIEVPGYSGIIMSNSFYSKLYEGYHKKQNDEGYVYITKGNTVYHTNKECKGIKTSAKLIFYEDIDSKRNSDGSKYYPCEHCKIEKDTIFVYVTPYGNRYHGDRECKDLKVNIYKIPESEKGERRKCYFCD